MKSPSRCPVVYRRIIRWLLSGLLLVSSTAFAAPPAPPASPPPSVPGETQPAEPEAAAGEAQGEVYYSFSFHDIQIPALAQIISDITGKNLLLDDRVQGKVTIFAPRKVTAEEAFGMFETVLNIRGYGMVPVGPGTDALKIVPRREVREGGTRTVTGELPAGAWEKYVTQIVPLKYLDATEVAQRFQQLISRDSLIIADVGTNSLIVTDTQDNIRKLLSILKSVDVKETEEAIEVFDLKHASADDLSQKILDILKEERTGAAGGGVRRPPTPGAPAAGGVATGEVGPGRSFKIIPYERTNSLIVVAGRMDMERIKELVTRLDFPTPLGNAKINVIRLKNAQADEMVQVLSAVISGASVSPISSSMAGAGRSPSSMGGMGMGQTGLGQTSTMSQRRTSSMPVSGGSSGQVQFTGEVRVTADPSTNSIIVSAAQEDFNTIRSVVEQLDIRRRQVFVEAVVLEVTLNDSQTLGLQSQGIAGTGDAVAMIRSTLGDTPLSNVISNPVTGFPPGFGAAISSTRTVELKDAQGNTIEVPAVAALIQALAANSDVNVLSTPNILTTDNVEAQIVVGQNVPFPTGTVYSQGGVTPVQTVERRDVGLTLKLTPHIGEGDSVRLDIFQEISSVIPTSNTQILVSVGPTTTLRSAETTVVVQDRQTVVIGGLIQDKMTDTLSKIPYLGDIPYLGWLFSVNSQTKEKVNLLILLTPSIIHDGKDLVRVSGRQRTTSGEFLDDVGMPNNLEQYLSHQQELDVRNGAQLPASPAAPGATPESLKPIPPEALPVEPAPAAQGGFQVTAPSRTIMIRPIPEAAPAAPLVPPGAPPEPATPASPPPSLSNATSAVVRPEPAAPERKPGVGGPAPASGARAPELPPAGPLSIRPIPEAASPAPAAEPALEPAQLQVPSGGLPGAPAGSQTPPPATAQAPEAVSSAAPASAEEKTVASTKPAPATVAEGERDDGQGGAAKPFASAYYGESNRPATPPAGFEQTGLHFGLVGAAIPRHRVIRVVVWVDGVVVHDHADAAELLGADRRLDLFIGGIAPGTHLLDVTAEIAVEGAKPGDSTPVSASYRFVLPDSGEAQLRTRLAAGPKPSQTTIVVE